jgi:hypothetical protein
VKNLSIYLSVLIPDKVRMIQVVVGKNVRKALLEVASLQNTLQIGIRSSEHIVETELSTFR